MLCPILCEARRLAAAEFGRLGKSTGFVVRGDSPSSGRFWVKMWVSDGFLGNETRLEVFCLYRFACRQPLRMRRPPDFNMRSFYIP